MVTLPTNDVESPSKQTILPKPMIVNKYNLWMKSMKALSASAFMNSWVSLGVNYSDKDLKTLK